jgi:hypothetical protein
MLSRIGRQSVDKEAVATGGRRAFIGAAQFPGDPWAIVAVPTGGLGEILNSGSGLRRVWKRREARDGSSG